MKITNLKIVSGSIGPGKVKSVKVTVRKKDKIVRKYVKRRAYTYCDFIVQFCFPVNENFSFQHYFAFANNPSVGFVPIQIAMGIKGEKIVDARICATQHRHALSFPLSDEIIVIGQTQARSAEKKVSWHDEQVQTGRKKIIDLQDNPESSDFPEEDKTSKWKFEGGALSIDAMQTMQQWHGNKNYSRKFEGTDVMRTVTVISDGTAYLCKVWVRNKLLMQKKCLIARMELAQAYCDTLNPFGYPQP